METKYQNDNLTDSENKEINHTLKSLVDFVNHSAYEHLKIENARLNARLLEKDFEIQNLKSQLEQLDNIIEMGLAEFNEQSAELVKERSYSEKLDNHIDKLTDIIRRRLPDTFEKSIDYQDCFNTVAAELAIKKNVPEEFKPGKHGNLVPVLEIASSTEPADPNSLASVVGGGVGAYFRGEALKSCVVYDADGVARGGIFGAMANASDAEKIAILDSLADKVYAAKAAE